jgi:hypothetical protein
MTSNVSAARQRNGANGTANRYEPPPSSMIATHLAPTNGTSLPCFDQEDFALLLEESLGSDEDGQPNLGTDVAVNHKLICVIIKAGLDTTDQRNDDPFRKDSDYTNQVQKCFEVIDLAIERTPEALFLPSKPDHLDSGAETLPLFQWLLRRLLSFVLPDQHGLKEAAATAWPLLSKIVASEKHCPYSFDNCTAITKHIEEITEGMAVQFPNVAGLTYSSRLALWR